MKYLDFRQLVPTPIFTPQLLRNVGATYTPSQLTEWQKKGYLAKLRGGVYAFSDTLPSLTPPEIAPHLVSPSYISLEYALSHHNLIPEAVFSVTSVTTKGTRTYELPQGNFSYRHLPPHLFFGYTPINDSPSPYNLAEPEKALLDYFYLTPRLTTLDDLTSLRLNLDLIDWSKLRSYLAIFHRPRLNRLVKLLEK